MLEPAGLQQAHTVLYRALLRLPSATCEDLAEALGGSAEETRELLRAMQARGMIGAAPGSRQFFARPPELAFASAVRSLESQAADLRATVATLTEEYLRRDVRRGANHLVEVVEGATSIAQRLEEIQEGAHREVRGLVKGPVIALAPEQNTVEDRLLTTGIRYRVIYDRTLLDLPGDPFLITKSAHQGEQARVASNLPLKMVIVDDELAVVPSTSQQPNGEPAALLVYRSGLLDALVALFESLWTAASPVISSVGIDPASDPAEPAPSWPDLHLLSLVLAGLTDQAVAARLGLSVRTVQRRISGLIQSTGVQTRLQLVWYATRRGWV